MHDQEVVKKIVKRKVGVAFPAPDDAEFVPAALERFQQIQSKDGLSKPPGTAELLTWLAVMIAEGVTTERVRSEVPVPAHQALIKDAKDYERLWGR